jgi:hypothetical protein
MMSTSVHSQNDSQGFLDCPLHARLPFLAQVISLLVRLCEDHLCLFLGPGNYLFVSDLPVAFPRFPGLLLDQGCLGARLRRTALGRFAGRDHPPGDFGFNQPDLIQRR